MTEPLTNPTSAYPVYPGPEDASGQARSQRSTRPGDSGPGFAPESARAHPVAYAALALSLICLLWLAISEASSGGSGYQRVRVGTQDCVSVPQGSGPAVLYCRTSGTIK